MTLNGFGRFPVSTRLYAASWSSAKVRCMDALAVKPGSGEWVGISQVKGKYEGRVGSGVGSGQKEETQK